MQQADFWQRPARQRVLDRLERMDRIEAGVRSAGLLLARLERSAGRGATEIVRRLALLAAALEAAIAAVHGDEPEDARLELRPVEPADATWRDRLVQMYLQWAEARGMRVRRSGPDAAGAVRLDVGGFAAWQALRAEAGLHVLETRVGDHELRRRVRVQVAPDPADATAAASPADTDTLVCRRYDDEPAPLVRDSVRGWRTGRLDRVLAGDFDLFS
jgi:ATP-dependent Clp protease ATP-binding subunit ClpC